MNEKTLELRTPCRDCIFAIYDEHYTRQIDCKMGRLEKFQKLNKAVEISDEETGLNYYQINTICNLIRSSEWAAHKENPEKKALEEIKIKAGIILIAKDNDEELLKSLDSVLNQTQKPVKIAVVFFQRDTSVSSFIKRIQEKDIKFDMVNVLDFADIENLIDSGVRKLQNTQFYITIKEGFELPNDFIEKLNRIINNDLRQISVVRAKNDVNGLVIQTKLHQLLDGNYNEKLQIKIENLAKEQKLEHMLINYDEVVSE